MSIELALIDKKEEYENILTYAIPNDNDGKPLPTAIGIFGAVIPKGAKNVEVANCQRTFQPSQPHCRCLPPFAEFCNVLSSGAFRTTEELQHQVSAPSVKQQLAAIRMLFDWLVIGQVVPTTPAAAVRGPKHVVKTGKTPVLESTEWRKLLKSIPDVTLRDRRDGALIATLTYSFTRINAALTMKVEDLRRRGAGSTVRLHEKGGKQHAMPCHHALAEALRVYIDAAGIAEDRKGWLFRTARGHNGSALSGKPMSRSDAWRMIRRRAVAAGLAEEIGYHTFRATGITACLANGGALEHAQEMAAPESPRTTKLYDRTKERLTQDEIERIRL